MHATTVEKKNHPHSGQINSNISLPILKFERNILYNQIYLLAQRLVCFVCFISVDVVLLAFVFLQQEGLLTFVVLQWWVWQLKVDPVAEFELLKSSIASKWSFDVLLDVVRFILVTVKKNFFGTVMKPFSKHWSTTTRKKIMSSLKRLKIITLLECQMYLALLF